MPSPDPDLHIVKAGAGDIETVSEILTEAAQWIEGEGMKLWELEELLPKAVKEDVSAGMYRLAMIGTRAAGCYRFQTEDMEFWDDVPHSDSAFVHRVAVKREFAGKRIAQAMLDHAKSEARTLGKRYLRLDCADRPKLRGVYEREGFEFHSIRQREPFPVARYQFRL